VTYSEQTYEKRDQRGFLVNLSAKSDFRENAPRSGTLDRFRIAGLFQNVWKELSIPVRTGLIGVAQQQRNVRMVSPPTERGDDFYQ
jgi:hypothetical protein